MPKKKRPASKENGPALSAGNFSDISGTVILSGRDSHVQQTTKTGLSTAEMLQAFDQLYAKIEAHQKTPSQTKEGVKAEVEEIQAATIRAAHQKEKLEEGFLLRRFHNIARIAPDLLDVVVASLVNPLAGLGVAAEKIAAKAKQET